MDINEVLRQAVEMSASDVHIKVGLPPVIRRFGALIPLRDREKLTNDDISSMAYSIMNQYQQAKFETTNEIDLAHSLSGVARFRVNCFRQRGSFGMVFRVVPTDPPNLEDLDLPEVLKKIAMERKGLILVTGTTGSGKSTTMAAMVNHINTMRNCHVITIEDPIEFLHRDRKSIINQREVGSDTNSFAMALRAALRQDPDVILVGEMRDRETIDIALTAAETGHLVLSTLHTLDAVETIMRIVSQYPPHQHLQIRLQLAGVLKAVISQRLLPRADGQGVVPAAEVLVSTARIRECITDETRTSEVPDAIAEGMIAYGMQTFDQSLMALVKDNKVSYHEAMRQATNPNDFALRMKGIRGTSDSKWDQFEGEKAEERGEDSGEQKKPSIFQDGKYRDI
ncbi:MAG: Twitching mobility protein [Deltaproteobacteria bacterium ADurb.BinA179]|jgi:twitching motility protein PilT|nr:type IV pilus twitching motility protein PilT [Bacteriovoracaceae bacterium]OPZ27904.1 MAG: Twitching mobility protein [Deltaproteobacteria bacterium ADurb.BinA179]HNU73716.1 type IV pilus twitching motility protein PilT [Deltaproteobacteria bacterium]HON60904.1 type IV pilus twitching motility protein PilT [Deltaproteobacteria bacterium]HPA83995.1 type IV pilus twitching motility protein PilT [Deltaproteobacteria bacterium]